MGRMSSRSMLETEGPSDAILHWHLTSNHFPPIEDGIAFARMAINAVEQGEGDEPIDTGPDVAVPRRAPSAWDVVESWHLQDFIEDDPDR